MGLNEVAAAAHQLLQEACVALSEPSRFLQMVRRFSAPRTGVQVSK